MSLNLRYPNITGLSEKEQITQIKSYLYQLVEQLNNTLSTLDSGDGSSQNNLTTEVQGSEMSYYELRSMILREIQQLDTMFDQLSTKMQSEYVTKEELQKAIESLSASAADT